MDLAEPETPDSRLTLFGGNPPSMSSSKPGIPVGTRCVLLPPVESAGDIQY